MSEAANPNPADGTGHAPPPLPPKKPDDNPPMEPNPYMGGGTPPA